MTILMLVLSIVLGTMIYKKSIENTIGTTQGYMHRWMLCFGGALLLIAVVFSILGLL